MKQLILLIGMILSSQILMATNIKINSKSDSIPTKYLSWGIDGASFTNGSYSNTHQIGISAEYRISKILGLEFGASYNLSNLDYRILGLDESRHHGITLDLSSKFYLGAKKKWFARAGIYNTQYVENPQITFNYKNITGIQTGIGRSFHINNQALNLETLVRYEGYNGLQIGLKAGIRF